MENVPCSPVLGSEQPVEQQVIYMIFVAPQADFAQSQPAFEAMLKSAQFK